MKNEERYCENCRAELPKNASECPQCGVFAGDVFNGKMPKEKKPRDFTMLIALLLVAAAAAGAWYWWQQKNQPAPVVFDTGPTKVVRQRPGGGSNKEAEAIRALRAHLAPRVKAECLAVTSQGASAGSYRLTAFDTCSGTRLGRFVVDGAGNVR